VVVSVEFFGVQRALTKTARIQIPIAKNGRVRDVFGYLMGYYPNLTLREEAVFVTVNSITSSMNHTLKPADTIAFLPHVGGG